MTVMRCRATPTARNWRAAKYALESWVFPDRTSLPTTTRADVRSRIRPNRVCHPPPEAIIASARHRSNWGGSRLARSALVKREKEEFPAFAAVLSQSRIFLLGDLCVFGVQFFTFPSPR